VVDSHVTSNPAISDVKKIKKRIKTEILSITMIKMKLRSSVNVFRFDFVKQIRQQANLTYSNAGARAFKVGGPNL